MRLKDKVAVITGAANGMGRSEAELFAAQGASIILTDVMEERGEAVAAGVRASGGQAHFLRADVTSVSDWDMVIDFAAREYGRLDILVNNAGISASAVGHLDDLAAWELLMSTNATSVFLGTRRASELMIEKQTKGSIVNISSIMGIAGSPAGHPGYYAAKAAVRNYTKAMACRLGEYGIRVNSVHPGFMHVMVNGTNASTRKDRAAITPLGRTGEPIEVAYGALFLASDEASFVTGTELVIDGGFLAK